jgi:hypothetical protein
MKTTIHRLLLPVLLCLPQLLFGIQLRLHGTVVEFGGQRPLADVEVKVFRNGERQHTVRTGANGRYSLVLDNHAEYVIRFSRQGRVSKCYAVDTRGAVWEGDKRVQDLEIEIVLFQPVPELDLGWFDMPMGMARFNPMTGHVAWSADYERRIRPEVDRLMAEIALRQEAVADRQSVVRPARN